jgi:hypothetical protein
MGARPVTFGRTPTSPLLPLALLPPSCLFCPPPVRWQFAASIARIARITLIPPATPIAPLASLAPIAVPPQKALDTLCVRVVARSFEDESL